ITLGAFLLALWTYWSAKQRERFKMGIDLILKLGERFESEPMRKRRCAAAAALIRNHSAEDPDVSSILDFFEELGYLLRRGAIDAQAIDNYFAFWIEMYWRATWKYRTEDVSPNVWDDAESLVATMEELEDWRVVRWRLRYRMRLI